jgi:hypothetical protein
LISLGAISRNIMYRDGAADVLASHASFAWNKAETRIRCTGASCGEIMDVPEGPDSEQVITVFARHQADMLPPVEAIDVPEPVAAAEPDDTEPEHVQPTPEPAGETVTEEAAAPKIRRDTKALTATIAELKGGDRVSAGFNHPRYGIFTVEGTVTKGGAGLDRNQLMVAGWYINLNERAAKHLHELEILAPAGKHEFAIPKPSESTEHVGIGG